MLRDPKQPLRVRVRHPPYQRAVTLDLGQGEIAAHRHVPGLPDNVPRDAEESARKLLPSAFQAASQLDRLECRDRHPLPVERVETADRIADHEKSVRERREALVSAAPVGGKAMGDQVPQGLRLSDRCEHVRRGDRGDECGVAVLVR